MAMDRYSRQMLFSPIGVEGQKKLQKSSVLIVGMGALGTVLANHMVRAGVGHVRFVDRDFVEQSNLQRQMLFNEQDVEHKLPKAVAAERKLKKINSNIEIKGFVGDVTAQNISDHAQGVDLILDGTDNFQTRFLMNDYCFKNKIPFVYGGVVSSRGLQATFIPDQTPCLRCLFDDAGGTNETCDTVGVVAPAVDVIASYQAIEALKWLVGQQQDLRKSLLSVDLWKNHSYEMKWSNPKKGCLTCDQQLFPALKGKDEDQITTLCGRETIQITPHPIRPFHLDDWSKHLKNIGKVEQTPFLIRCHVDQVTLVLFTDGRVLVQGTEDVALAKTIYARYIGM